MGTGFAKKKKQAKMLQDQLSRVQSQMENVEATGTSGNGLVSITLSGEHEVKKIKINPECVDKEDIEGLEDLIKAAFNDAAHKLKDSMPNMPTMPGFGPGAF